VPRHPGPTPRRLDAAVAALRRPDIGDRFNWALDWFDPFAGGNPRIALRIIEEDRRNLRPFSASGASNSWNFRRPSPARSDVSSCDLTKTPASQMI
jgi:hypothetical protein